jgi:Domain of Unknown Function (DUF928)
MPDFGYFGGCFVVDHGPGDSYRSHELRGSSTLLARRAFGAALLLGAMLSTAYAAGMDVAGEPPTMADSESTKLRLVALSDWPGPRAQEYLPEAARGDTRRLGDEVRGGISCPGPISLAVLTPPYAGVTIKSQPTLFWFLGTDTGARVEVELYAEDGIDPLLTETYRDGLRAGFHGVALADQGVHLETDVAYEWSVAVICDPDDPAGDIVSIGAIRHVAAPPDLLRQLDGASLERRAELLVEHGIWYDALEVLASLIERHPTTEQWREAWDGLLEQVGLHEAAAYDP